MFSRETAAGLHSLNMAGNEDQEATMSHVPSVNSLASVDDSFYGQLDDIPGQNRQLRTPSVRMFCSPSRITSEVGQ